MSTLRILALAAVLGAFVAGAATAQTAPSGAVNAGIVGHWVYDQNGATIGSVRDLSADGRTAKLMMGSYFQQGSHEAQVPAGALMVRNGRVILQPETMQALNGPAR